MRPLFASSLDVQVRMFWFGFDLLEFYWPKTPIITWICYSDLENQLIYFLEFQTSKNKKSEDQPLKALRAGESNL